MLNFIRSLPMAIETAILVTVVFGYFISTSLLRIPYALASHPISDGRLIGLVVFELVLAALAFGLLFVRGWNFKRLGFTALDLRSIGFGFALFVFSYLAAWVAWVVAYSLFGHSLFDVTRFSFTQTGNVSMGAVILLCIVNPIFEETFVCGYLISLRPPEARSWTFVHLSVAIRLLYHLYQGAVAAINILPGGLILALWFQRNRQIWPLIIAHAIMDFLALLPFLAQQGT